MTRAPSSRHIASRKSKLRVQQRRRDVVRYAPRSRRSSLLVILLLTGVVALLIWGLAGTNAVGVETSTAFAEDRNNTTIALLVFGIW